MEVHKTAIRLFYGFLKGCPCSSASSPCTFETPHSHLCLCFSSMKRSLHPLRCCRLPLNILQSDSIFLHVSPRYAQSQEHPFIVVCFPYASIQPPLPRNGSKYETLHFSICAPCKKSIFLRIPYFPINCTNYYSCLLQNRYVRFIIFI